MVRIFQPVHGYDVRRELVAWHAEEWANVAPGSIYNAREDALAPLLDMVSVPVLLLSGILLPMTLAPAWLPHIAEANPFFHVVDGARAAFRGARSVWYLLAFLRSSASRSPAGPSSASPPDMVRG